MQLAPAHLCSYLMVPLLNKRTHVPSVFALPLSSPSCQLGTNPTESCLGLEVWQQGDSCQPLLSIPWCWGCPQPWGRNHSAPKK